LAAVWKTAASVGEYQIGKQSTWEITSFARVPFAMSLNKSAFLGADAFSPTLNTVGPYNTSQFTALVDGKPRDSDPLRGMRSRIQLFSDAVQSGRILVSI
jgi:hypothetical protein